MHIAEKKMCILTTILQVVDILCRMSFGILPDVRNPRKSSSMATVLWNQVADSFMEVKLLTKDVSFRY